MLRTLLLNADVTLYRGKKSINEASGFTDKQDMLHSNSSETLKRAPVLLFKSQGHK